MAMEGESTPCDTVDEMDSLLLDCDKLTVIYALMQRQCSHRLSKISLFIMKIGDIRSLYESGCKWVKKESSARQLEIESSAEADIGGIFELHGAMTDIERKVAGMFSGRGCCG